MLLLAQVLPLQLLLATPLEHLRLTQLLQQMLMEPQLHLTLLGLLLPYPHSFHRSSHHSFRSSPSSHHSSRRFSRSSHHSSRRSSRSSPFSLRSSRRSSRSSRRSSHHLEAVVIAAQTNAPHVVVSAAGRRASAKVKS